MGFDYFLPVQLRDKLDQYVKTYFKVVHHRMDNSVKEAVNEFIPLLPRVVISLFQILFGSLCFYISHKTEEYSEIISILLLIPFLIYVIAGFNFAFSAVFDLLKTLGLAAPIRLVTTFLIHSPKGPVSAVGFLCLCISFYLSYIFA